ncbi:hypothetical protein [Corynebacterium nuruki]|uniref:hypothetical protein n=1 Tax=Corynebacterium nuruki TaxID=1032851 RepID=UPI0002485460|nr:hypothetical protein [Corynebacterium nuruki]
MSLTSSRLSRRLGVSLVATAAAVGLAVPAATAANLPDSDNSTASAADSSSQDADNDGNGNDNGTGDDDAPVSGAAALSSQIQSSLDGDVDLQQTVSSLTGTDWGKLITTTVQLSSGTVTPETVVNIIELVSGEDVTVSSAVDAVAGSIASGSSDDTGNTDEPAGATAPTK